MGEARNEKRRAIGLRHERDGEAAPWVVAKGSVEVDGKEIYRADKVKVGVIFEEE